MYDCYEALLFDMDGTILDTKSAHSQAWRQVLTPYGIHFDEKKVSRMNGMTSYLIVKKILEENQLDLDPQKLAEEKTAIVKPLLLSSAKPLPLIEIVKAYYGSKPMAIGTGSEHAIAEDILQHLDLKKYFNVIVGADDVQNHKPAPDTFLRCAHLLGVSPEKCIVFEDADLGIEAAKRAGMTVVDVRLL